MKETMEMKCNSKTREEADGMRRCEPERRSIGHLKA
jgi:hypothetical protein